jgi:aldehyde:ferredoxin oxidoreductase
MAWARKILRVNLTEGTCKEEPLNMEWAMQYLGQRGLATKYLVEEIDPKVDPLSPENKLIFATGPLTGTGASTSARYSVITKSPLTNCVACSNSGGYFGAELKNAGWDMIIFEGRAERPVYLVINDDEAELHDASEIWGKSVWHADDWIKERHQEPMFQIAAIGVPGEVGVLFSAVVNNKHRAAGRSGVGTVMGAKNLKAVAVRGTRGVQVHDPEAFEKAVEAAKKVLAENAVTGQALPTYGTQVLMNVINEIGALPTRNARDVQFEGADDISGEAMHRPRRSDGRPNLVRNAGCFGCTIACGRISQIDPTHFSVKDKPEYHHASGGVEYENAWALGADTGVNDLEALTYCNYRCNEHALDPITTGSTIAAAMELFETGAMTLEDTGGIELRFGSAEALCAAVDAICEGTEFGRLLGLGSKRLCEKFGRPELSMTVKGQEFPAYDPRGIQGMGLTYATSNRGACHLRSYTVASEVLGIPEKTDPLVTEGKAALVKAFQDATAAVDSTGLCIFTTFAWSLEDIAPQVDAACEGEWTVEKLLEVGERIWNLERKFNLDAGITPEEDTLPRRILKEAAKTGPAKGLVNRLEEMLPEYYELRGWTPEGYPRPETLQRLGLA